MEVLSIQHLVVQVLMETLELLVLSIIHRVLQVQVTLLVLLQIPIFMILGREELDGLIIYLKLERDHLLVI